MIQTISLLLLASMLSSVVEGSYFTANKPSRQRDPLNRRQYFLKFQNVLTNSDGSFLPEYGAYSAPFPGYYCFELCVPKTGRRGKISLYKFSNNGPEKIITLKPRNSAKCYNLILHLNKRDFIYNVVFGGNFPNHLEEFIFTGYLLPDPPVSPKLYSGNGGVTFPYADALPVDQDDHNNDGDRNKKFPFRIAGGVFRG